MTLDELPEGHGCTPVMIDTEKLEGGIRKVTQGSKVLLTSSSNFSAYGYLVKQALVKAGKNAADFVLQDLPWGKRVPDSPLIEHKGKFYVQTILLEPGDTKYYIGDTEVTAEQLHIAPRRTNQGLKREDEIIVNTYALDSVKSMVISA